MVILISLVVMGIYFLLLSAVLLFNKYGSRETVEKFNIVLYAYVCKFDCLFYSNIIY